MMLGEVEKQTQETCTETSSSEVSLVRNKGSGDLILSVQYFLQTMT